MKAWLSGIINFFKPKPKPRRTEQVAAIQGVTPEAEHIELPHDGTVKIRWRFRNRKHRGKAPGSRGKTLKKMVKDLLAYEVACGLRKRRSF